MRALSIGKIVQWILESLRIMARVVKEVLSHLLNSIIIKILGDYLLGMDDIDN